MSKTKNIAIQFPILGILTIIFVIAKITGHLDWEWWQVFIPLMIPAAIVVVVLSIGLVVALLRALS